MSPVILPKERLDCPDPARCPVAVRELTEAAGDGTVPATSLKADSEWFRVFNAVDGYATPIPGQGNSRFSPFDDESNGERVPSIYLAESLEASLLETSLHHVPIKTPPGSERLHSLRKSSCQSQTSDRSSDSGPSGRFTENIGHRTQRRCLQSARTLPVHPASGEARPFFDAGRRRNRMALTTSRDQSTTGSESAHRLR